MKTYIKFFGSFGSGKTTMVRELTTLLTGKSCDFWNKKFTQDGILKYNQCNCGKFIVLGKWKVESKCCGVDSISSQPEFNFFDRIIEDEKEFQCEIIFDEGILNASQRIMNNIDTKYNFFPFHMNYINQFCFNNIIKRGGTPNMKNINEKIKCFESNFKLITSKQKSQLSGTIRENIDNVISKTCISPCNCMIEKGDV